MQNGVPTNWSHITLVYYGCCEKIIVYQNGTQIGVTFKVSGYYTPTSGKLVIGRLLTDIDHYYGTVMVDDLKIWNSPLTEEAIQEVYNS